MPSFANQPPSRRPATHLTAAVSVLALVALAVNGAVSGPAAAARPDLVSTPLVSPGGPMLSESPAGAGEPLLVVLDEQSSRGVSRVASSVASHHVMNVVEAGGGSVRRDLSTAGVISVTADAGTVDELAEVPGVAAVIPDEPLLPLGGEPSVPSGELSVRSGMYDAHPVSVATAAPSGWPAAGAGRTVAVLDTGVMAAHPSLAGKVVASACFSTNQPASGITSACAGTTPELLGEPCDFAQCNHGTSVAGVAVGAVTSGPAQSGGLAPGADIAAVQVFSKVTQLEGCAAGCARAYTSDVVAALNWLVSVAHAIDLAAVNLSIGGLPGASQCTTDPGGPAIRQLRAMGIPVIAAAGNHGHPELVSWPACAPDVVAVAGSSSAVGGTWSSMVIDRFNSGPKVEVAAPGYGVPAPVPGHSTWWLHSGTSFASPAVAGAAAAWRAEHPDADVDGLLAAITAGTVADLRTGATYPRLWVADLFPPPASTTTTTTTAAPPTTIPPVPTSNRRALQNFERAAVSGRTVRMSGWAYDPDGGKPRVRLLVDSKVVAQPPVSIRRDDVWNFLGREVDRHSGWSHARELPVGTHTVCSEITDAGRSGFHSRTCHRVVIK